MLKSMTAFSRVQTHHDATEIVWEIRSINHRYLETSFRLPEELRALEFDLRKIAQEHLSRGKLDCIFRLSNANQEVTELSLNQPLLDALIQQAQAVSAQLGESTPATALELLSWPGVVVKKSLDHAQLALQSKTLFKQGLQDLVEHRQLEGGRMTELITQRGQQMRTLVQQVRLRRPLVLEAIREKIKGRIAEFDIDMEPARLEQELVFLMQKLDVAEELDRLDSHLTELEDILQQDEAVGRRLDFLMQEFNREANTLGSKSADIVTTQATVDMKVAIEQMREQIQNIE